MKKALIIGCNGQDGRYLYELLNGKGYQVIGVDVEYIFANYRKFSKPLNIESPKEICDFLKRHNPLEIYYLAAYHHSAENAELDSYQLLVKSLNVNGIGLLNFLNAMQKETPYSRLFYAGSSHAFGLSNSEIQDETTPLAPVCPYGISKVTGIHLCRYYRAQKNLFVSVGILYNHESPLRPISYVSKKIVQAAVAIKKGLQQKLVLGNLQAQVDWGYAKDVVNAMHMILQLEKPDDFVVATGKLHTVQDFVEFVFSQLGLDWQHYVEENPGLIVKQSTKRTLQGNIKKLQSCTGWKPSLDLKGLAKVMIKAELENG